ncbi:response regulator [Rhodopseudomonas sp. B29]|uniref:response regulator n=1 Tax=Rhodopseudomonas sp. B29 TaxID=95607 RepID=UPI00034A6465|nr:response regulator [Rhodopseudomonas sp. B29]
MKTLRAASLARLGGLPRMSSPGIADAGNHADGAPMPHAPQGLSVLVAEDNDINALLIRSLLTPLGHNVVVAPNGEEAVAQWRDAAAPFDLILMDVQMPRLDGLGAARQIRAHEAAARLRPVPMLALTANTQAEDRDACLKAGMTGFLVKPLDRDKLLEVLADVAPAANSAPHPTT